MRRRPGVKFPLHVGDWTFPGYTAFYTLILNLLIAIVLTPLFKAMSAARADATVEADYRS